MGRASESIGASVDAPPIGIHRVPELDVGAVVLGHD
jgi:hypothetical protein